MPQYIPKEFPRPKPKKPKPKPKKKQRGYGQASEGRTRKATGGVMPVAKPN